MNFASSNYVFPFLGDKVDNDIEKLEFEPQYVREILPKKTKFHFHHILEIIVK